MRLERGFRLSLYLSLLLANLCLGLAEQSFFPGIPLFLVPLLLLFLLALLLEGRWTLPIKGANLLALGLFGGWSGWVAWRLLLRPPDWLRTVPFPAALLPFVGPLVMLLVTVKLFRPKLGRDFWQLQILGLMAVALGCVLASSPSFGLFLLAYALGTLWCLSRAQDSGPEAQEQAGRPLPVLFGLGTAWRWGLGSLVLGLPLFLLLPRGRQDQWHPFALFLQGGAFLNRGPTSLALLDQIDLNLTGRVQLDDEVALTVHAEDSTGAPKLDLSGEQRWRGAVLDAYKQGRWHASSTVPVPFLVNVSSAPPSPRQGILIPPVNFVRKLHLMDLGPDQYYLEFDMNTRRSGGLFLSDPVVIHPPGVTQVPKPLPGSSPFEEPQVVVPLGERSEWGPLFLDVQGTLVPAVPIGWAEYRYRQVTLPFDDPDLGPPLLQVDPDYVRALMPQPFPQLTDWTTRLLRRLAADPQYHLTETDLAALEKAGSELETAPEHWEKPARALTTYLAASGDYTYTLDLRRQDQKLDPTLDFLWNVKEGHCERYAGGLALMLRSVGIPARVVKGYRGANSLGEGNYDVRHSQAHSWVEVLLRRPGKDGQPEWHWLTLDPTPSAEMTPTRAFSLSRSWNDVVATGQWFWTSRIVEYTPEEQANLWESLSEKAPGWPQLRSGSVGWWPAVVVLSLALLVGLIAGRRWGWQRRRGGATPGLPVYRRLLAILARRCGLHPQPSQTPREFAGAAHDRLCQVLAGVPQLDTLSALPLRCAALLYRVRYGGQPLTDEETQSLQSGLEQLDAALALQGYNRG